MSDDLTPWEDINPPMVSAPRHELQSQSSDDEARTVFRNELTACLALTAPAGMTEEGRRDWLMVAWDSLRHLPPDLLRDGANAARLKCDHPSKIVPTIVAETAERLKWRTPTYEPSTPLLSCQHKRHVLDRRGEAMSDEETAQLNDILQKLGATKRYRPDGSKYDAST